MKSPKILIPWLAAIICAFLVCAVSHGEVKGTAERQNAEVEKAILKRMEEIQRAAEALDPEKVFSFVMENDKGALVQDGKLMLTRKEALESTKAGFRGLKKVEYAFNQQHVSVVAPGVAIATGEGSSTAETSDGRTFTAPFAQTVVFVLTNGDWKVFHAHRSFPAR